MVKCVYIQPRKKQVYGRRMKEKYYRTVSDEVNAQLAITTAKNIVQKYSPDVDLYALHKLNRYDAV